MTYCHVPWTHIDISPLGEISPCCKFKNSHYKNKVSNINEVSINDYLQSHTLKEVKKDFTNGVWPKGCERCKIEEENGIESRRLIEYNRWADHLDDHQNKGFISASIAFGNACNLTCITCDPSSSSKWHQEYKKLYGINIKPNLFYKEDFVENVYNNIPNLKHLDIPGGEPLLSGVDQQKELLQKLIVVRQKI
jgi:radical SAM protein with 4Fe4S-binding SPASM domain